jgi:hypothetical protein
MNGTTFQSTLPKEYGLGYERQLRMALRYPAPRMSCEAAEDVVRVERSNMSCFATMKGSINLPIEFVNWSP